MNPLVFKQETWFQDEDRSIAYITLNGVNCVTRNRRSTTRFGVVGGEGVFQIGERTIPVMAGNVIEVHAGAAYYGKGDLAMLATSMPPLCSKDIEIISISPDQ